MHVNLDKHGIAGVAIERDHVHDPGWHRWGGAGDRVVVNDLVGPGPPLLSAALEPDPADVREPDAVQGDLGAAARQRPCGLHRAAA